MISIEQLLNSLPLEKRLWLVEKKPESCVTAGELVDEFEQTRRRGAEGNKSYPATPFPSINLCSGTKFRQTIVREQPVSTNTHLSPFDHTKMFRYMQLQFAAVLTVTLHLLSIRWQMSELKYRAGILR